MRPTRTGALAAALVGIVAAGVASALSWPSSEDALPCPPGEVRWVKSGEAVLATCDGSAPPAPGPAAQALTVGRKLDLNRASAAELTHLPGIGPSLAEAIVLERGRLGRFGSWEEVDGVKGVGPAKAEVLKRLTTLGP